MEAKRIFDERVNVEIEKRMAERDAEQERLDKIQEIRENHQVFIKENKDNITQFYTQKKLTSNKIWNL